MSIVTIVALLGGAILIALCATTSWLVLRHGTRVQIRQMPGWHLLAAAVVAALPWVYVFTRGGHVSIQVHTNLELAGFIIVLLLAIIAFLLYPLAVVIIAIVWLLGRWTAVTSP